MFVRARAAPPIKCMNRWPAVMLAVSRTARATGWIKRLMVSIITSLGIRGIGVPCGRKVGQGRFSFVAKPGDYGTGS